MPEPESVDMGKKASSGYNFGPPWFFGGRALYQLHLVKSKVARSFVPKELKLVEAFGYTLGGMFLAQYEDSPAGKFDELVIIAGIVWNPPTSCAWAARVLVNSSEACVHGRKEVGLPSHVASFMQDHNVIKVSENNGSPCLAPFEINLPSAFVDSSRRNQNLMGHNIKMSLPSFSGRTVENPDLLKYSCEIECRVRPVKPAEISCPETDSFDGVGRHGSHWDDSQSTPSMKDDAQRDSISILLSRPLLALEFNSLRMRVGAPQLLDRHPKTGFST